MNTKLPPPTFPRPSRPAGRRGSVLILVVALLVLMALIGTAWISTSRVDRAATIELSRGTEGELLIDGVKNLANAAIVADVVTAGSLRRGVDYAGTDGTVTDKYMASRVPVFVDEVAPVWEPTPPPGRLDPPVYEQGRLARIVTGGNRGEYFICTTTHTATAAERPGGSGYWIKLGDYDLGSNDPNQNPVFWPATSSVLPPDTKFEDPAGLVAGYTQRTAMQVSTLPPDVNGRRNPSFKFYHAGLGRWVEAMAADTDGDGQPDANYFKLPVGRVNGLDWYAAIRIVDNNSAVNMSVASSQDPPAVAPVAHFPSSLSLVSAPFLLVGQNQQEITDQRQRLNNAQVDEDPNNDFSGTFVTPPTNVPPVNDLVSAGARQRPDFEFATVQELLWMVGGRRQRNPGYWGPGIRMKALPASDAAVLAYRGGTLINPDSMVRPMNTASSLLERLLPETLFGSADNHPNLPPVTSQAGNPFYITDVRGKSLYANDNKFALSAAVELFARNNDYLGRWTAEDTGEPITYRNRRHLMTVSNPVSQAVPSRLVPRNVANFAATMPGPWSNDVNYDVGDYVTQNVGGVDVVFACVSPVSAGSGAPPGATGNTVPIVDHPRRLVCWEPRPFEHVPTKVSANTGSFGQLFLGFWQTMAEPATLQRPRGITPADQFPPESQTPFKDAFRGEMVRGVYAQDLFDSPYFGNRFVAPLYGAVIPAYPPYSTAGAAPDQHPLRHFRSPIRSVPSPTAPGFDEETPRLMTDHTARLRAALAAVNAMDMRDGDDNVTVKEISLGVTINLGGTNRLNELDDTSVYARARVYGHERQPFLTEIYANTNTTDDGPTGEAANMTGYVAVEFYNPYPFHIDLRNCKIATIDRSPGPTPVSRRNLTVLDSLRAGALTPHLRNATTNLAAPGGETFPWVVPANGFLVLENYDSGGADPNMPPGETIVPNPAIVVAPANYRPRATGLLAVGPVAPTVAGGAVVRNYAYVPNLHTVLDKEMVLVRPLGAVLGTTQVNGANEAALIYTEPPTSTAISEAVDMAPLDSYDFTGIPNLDPIVSGGMNRATVRPTPTQAFAWHYARAFQPSPAPATTKAWRFVYPGRYDGHQTLDMAGGVPRPRQQGTQEVGSAIAGWDPQVTPDQDPWDPLNTTTPAPPTPGITLNDLPVGGINLQASYFPHEYAIQLTNSIVVGAGSAGPRPVTAATGNTYPFGGFARNVDVLQVPYIGSYRIKLTPYGFPPLAFNPVSGVTTQVTANPGAAAYPVVLELNSVSMDSAFAEDSDPSNHYNPTLVTPATDPLVLPPENIGRFTPTVRDLEIAGAGFVVDASYNPAPAGGGPRPIRAGTMRAGNRPEGNGAWNLYEIAITDGPGKGQVRPVIAFSGGTFAVFPDWETQLVPNVSRYVLRKSALWKEAASPFTRTTGNKFWAADLLDFLTVDSPQTDFLPSADPISYAARFPGMLPPQAVSTADPNSAPAVSYAQMTGGGAGNPIGSANLIDRAGFYTGGFLEFVTGPAAGQVRRVTNFTSGGANRSFTLNAPMNPGPVSGDVFRVFGKNSEDLVGAEGLVNINTAPWPVLAQLPWGMGAGNALLAQEIVKYRDGDPSAGVAPQGPFRSLFDLYKVPVFNAAQSAILTAANPVDAQGDFVPDVGLPAAGSVRYDFEEQYLLLNRVSNMITTRSDSFTVYILVQGWRDAGDATRVPELVVQRRRAYTADRTGLTPANKELPIQYLYND